MFTFASEFRALKNDFQESQTAELKNVHQYAHCTNVNHDAVAKWLGRAPIKR